jgi:hypothetical protein
MRKTTLTGLAVGIALTTAMGLSAPALAHGTGNSKAHGDCSMGSTWYLKADANRGGQGHTVEVSFQIRTQTGGEAWNWVILDNGTEEASGQNTTDSNGNLQERQSVQNQKGPDAIELQATDTVTGETCVGDVLLKGSH